MIFLEMADCVSSSLPQFSAVSYHISSDLTMRTEQFCAFVRYA